MRRTEDQLKRWAALTGILLVAAAEALAQENGAQPQRRIVVSIPDHKLALIENGRVVKIYCTAVGAARTPSPTGSFRIIQRVSDPAWYYKGKVVPPGKSNPVGPRWIGLNLKGYGIHGTNNPRSIGHNASHGCIRMRNRDVVELFKLVAVGDPVELYGKRTPELEQIFEQTEIAQATPNGQ
ncbi:MAG TPA: L,D-transpeptidase [Bryobacteraceae bacterium]|nr:L,D-transpeptidase [Bryobacteraceae bacterium]